MAQKSHNEAALIKACIKGNRKAQYTLYERHKTYLYGLCLRYAKTPQEAQDILQEGFFRILKDINQFSGKSTLQTWMRKVMVNSALMHIRKFRKIEFSVLEVEKLENVKLSEDTFQIMDRANAVIHLIQKLPLSYQTVFNLRAMEGYSFKEISQQLNTNEATLRSHYLRARKQLQEILNKEFKKNG